MRSALLVVLALGALGWFLWSRLPAGTVWFGPSESQILDTTAAVEADLRTAPALLWDDPSAPLSALILGRHGATLTTSGMESEGRQPWTLTLYRERDGVPGCQPSDDILDMRLQGTGAGPTTLLFGNFTPDGPEARIALEVQGAANSRSRIVFGAPWTEWPPAPSPDWQPLVLLRDEGLAVDWRFAAEGDDLALRWRALDAPPQQIPGLNVSTAHGEVASSSIDPAALAKHSLGVEAALLRDIGPGGVRITFTPARHEGELQALRIQLEAAGS